ncbi:MAG TPA: ABC transporter ATP-binding protein [Anaerolineales bacterium]|nr:ABC transporter ATP-binding protein [Anaerolineales bacterium]
MNFFGGLDAESYDRTYRDRELARRMWGYFRPHARKLTWISLAILTMSVAGAAGPLLVSAGVQSMAEGVVSRVTFGLAALLFLMGLIVWGANWVRRRLSAQAVGDVMLELRADAFRATVGHDLSFFSEHASGRVVSRITSDTQEFAQVVVLVTDVVSQILEAMILLAVLVFIEWRLLPWLLIFLPVLLVVSIGFRRLARRVTRRGFRAMANVNAIIKEAVTGIAVAKNFRQEDAIYQEFAAVNAQSYRINVQRGFVLAAVFPTLNALGGAGTALLVYIGGMSVMAGVITYGAWYLFISSLDYFWFPVLNLSAFWSQVQGGLSAAERVFGLIDAEAAVVQTELRSVPPLQGDVVFDRVDFRYTHEPVLESFSLHIRPGEDVALVGHTGAGKSTIAKLISRFYEYQGGALRLDGQDIRTLNLTDYRRQLGIVPQVPFLFSGTVADNVRYARPEASQAEMCTLARKIGEGEWLETLPDGLETEVGERGGRLSMGQRQLVSLLRVLVQRPAIFILDEATASIDPFTEYQIQQALRLILEESTSILIAHRLSTVRAADRIIVLRQGAIIEEGNHDQLLRQGGHYAELYNAYFRHQSLQYIESARQMALGDKAGS